MYIVWVVGHHNLIDLNIDWLISYDSILLYVSIYYQFIVFVIIVGWTDCCRCYTFSEDKNI